MISVEYCQLAARYNRWMNERLYAVAAELSDADWLAATFEYRAAADGKVRQLPGWIAAMHLFQHGVHHRGQATTLLKQAGKDVGATDLPWLPGVTHVL